MELSDGNVTSTISHTLFILLGFPGVTKLHPFLAIPFSTIYALILSGNVTIMAAIAMERTLHTPMYTLIFFLLAVNVVYTSAITPKMLLVLFGLNRVTLVGCLLQIFTVYSSIMAETTLLMMMAIDRYLAISQPLHYVQIVSRHLKIHFFSNIVIRLGFVIIPLLQLVARLQYCRTNVVHHFHCEPMMLFSISCDDNVQSRIVAIGVRSVVTLGDISIILVSYLKALHAVMKMVVGSARHKALHTCSTHLLVVSLMYTSGIISTTLNLPGVTANYDVQNASSAIYFLVPSSLNPFIYGLRMKNIKEQLMRYRRRERIRL